MTRNKHVCMTTPATEARFELVPAVAPAVPQPADNGQPAPDPDECSLPTLRGYAIVWNVPSSDDRKTVIRRGAVSFTSPVLALYGHDNKDVIGNTANGTLRMTSDDYGLRVEIDPPDTQPGRDVCELVEDRYVTGMSFGCFVNKSHKEGDTAVYDDITVDEVSIVSTPAFPQTSITVDGSVDDSMDTSIDEEPGDFAAALDHMLRLEALRFGEMEL